MRTEELINALVADAVTPTPRVGRVLNAALGVGAVLAAIAFFLAIGPRPDLAAAILTPRFLSKVAVTAVLVFASALAIPRLATPDAPLGARLYAFAAPLALLLIAVAIELFVTPASSWEARLIGVNAKYCVALIPFLSLAPLACLFYAMRDSAPANPGLAGAGVGLLAGAVGATLYAFHCIDDSPLFQLVWYTLAIAIVVSAGYAAGRRFLRW